ncbi:MAG: tRNA uridine-5-carboxymethylaminomethyl(34) synthesis enzyme MnmG [Candidatus Fischerbacteria bacterium RBG_13_37_8]|uniref:tRNA uridine 5-carboxymethylaminomethyl modification enzyme MnmG n=1 Tax=Candidatus Fischerbacteria bacterium RBG_13_37_8 TaxID=1817863 RepID=A0A1F5VDC6_9BACT|nr:MAG: tRNA uridine-5-carboxymethylaminomethyl(34) synthesis enzyme MnmG [Candidatus Fischerbacteria bacterium RBG_13_37_8]
MDTYEIIVIGGGHAGCEAAHVAGTMGLATVLVTMRRDAIARMSCNPSIGGIGKSQIVRDLDAMGGIMSHVADETGIQFRLLNKKKGPSVWSPRCQSDKELYARLMQQKISKNANIEIVEGEMTEIIVRDEKVRGIKLKDGRILHGKAVIVATGTFLNGLMHIGMQSYTGGRVGEEASAGAAASLKELGFQMGRLKTGTSPRLKRSSIDYGKMEIQEGDKEPVFFSYDTKEVNLPQEVCYITYTTEETHRIIRNNLSQSPLYGGIIKGIGPRYCPSIEDKVVRFADKQRHQLFIEPEGLASETIYVNGLSTSLPMEIQQEIVASIKGLASAEIIKPGYAIEYDYVDPTELQDTLETRKVGGLYMAGQINGTTGYEEAAGLGFIAAINAANSIKGERSFKLPRWESYIGVMIHDLTRKGVREPYRMFTSRAEYRLLLRIDNADLRLTEYGHKLGLVDKKRYAAYCERKEKIEKAVAYIKGTSIARTEWGKEHDELKHMNLEKVIKRPDIKLREIAGREKEGVLSELSKGETESLEMLIKYEGYISRMLQEVEQYKRWNEFYLPHEFDYSSISGLRREIIEKIERHKPETLAEAMMIEGITPSACAIIYIYFTKGGRKKGSRKKE